MPFVVSKVINVITCVCGGGGLSIRSHKQDHGKMLTHCTKEDCSQYDDKEPTQINAHIFVYFEKIA